jgi:hypothetical protein
MAALCVLLLLLASSDARSNYSNLTHVDRSGLTVETAADGGYVVLVDGVHWLQGNVPTYLPDVAIKQHNTTTTSGADQYGKFSATTRIWNDPSDHPVLATTITAYSGGEVVHFTQRWIAGVANVSQHFNTSVPVAANGGGACTSARSFIGSVLARGMTGGHACCLSQQTSIPTAPLGLCNQPQLLADFLLAASHHSPI